MCDLFKADRSHVELAIGVQREPLVDIPLNNDIENTAPSQSNSVRSVVERPVEEDTLETTRERQTTQSLKSTILAVEKGQAHKRAPANAKATPPVGVTSSSNHITRAQSIRETTHPSGRTTSLDKVSPLLKKRKAECMPGDGRPKRVRRPPNRFGSGQ